MNLSTFFSDEELKAIQSKINGIAKKRKRRPKSEKDVEDVKTRVHKITIEVVNEIVGILYDSSEQIFPVDLLQITINKGLPKILALCSSIAMYVESDDVILLNETVRAHMHHIEIQIMNAEMLKNVGEILQKLGIETELEDTHKLVVKYQKTEE